MDKQEELKRAYLVYRAEWRRTHKESVQRSNRKYYLKRKALLAKAKGENDGGHS